MEFQTFIKENLAGFDFDTIQQSNQIIYGLSDDFKLIYYNEAFLNFAQNNSTENINTISPIGLDFTSILPTVLKDFYLNNLKATLSKGTVWHHDYECSSDTTFRLFNLSAYPLKDKSGILIVNKIRIEEQISKHKLADHKPLEKIYTHETGFINQCSNCRSIQRVDDTTKWDWVSSWVKKMPANVSHNICPVCFDYYWKYAD